MCEPSRTQISGWWPVVGETVTTGGEGATGAWRVVLAVVMGVCLPALASAQPIVNPSRVVFTPSTDHANPAVTGYEFGYFAINAPDPVVKTLITKAQLVAQGSDFDFAFPRLAFGVGFEHRLRMCADGWVGFGGAVCSLWVTADKLSTVSPLAAASVRLTP